MPGSSRRTYGRPRGGASPPERRSRGCCLAEVSLDPPPVLLELLRRTLRDLLAVVEHGYALGCAHHDLHVVLDQENRDRALLAERADEGEERGGFLWVHPGGRLVQEQQLRLGRERAGDLEPTLVAVGEGLCELVVRSSQPREAEQLARLLLGLALLAPNARQPED